MRVRASNKAASFRRQDKLARLHAQAEGQVQALKQELEEDAGASTRRKQAARERAARDRQQRLVNALDVMKKIKPAKQPNPSKRRGKKDDGSGAGSSKPKAPAEPRVSTTDAEARVMKMGDRGFRPAYNVQLTVDAETHLISCVEVVNTGSDMELMAPMHEALRQRYDCTPGHWQADGGFTTPEAINELTERGTQPVVPPPRSRNPAIDCLQPTPDNTPAQVQWR